MVTAFNMVWSRHARVTVISMMCYSDDDDIARRGQCHHPC